MHGVETILFLVALGTVVAAFAGRLRVPAPSLLVIAGLITSGGTWTGGNLGSKATISPAITSRDGAGTLSRPANAATTVPSTTRNKMVSTPCTPLTSPVRLTE